MIKFTITIISDIRYTELSRTLIGQFGSVKFK